MKAAFDNYGGKHDFLPHSDGKFEGFNDTAGGVDPYGVKEAKKKDAMNMNAAMTFNKKDLSKIDAMGTEAPKKSNKKAQRSDNDGDHLKTDTENCDIDPFGTEAGKTKSGQSRH